MTRRGRRAERVLLAALATWSAALAAVTLFPYQAWLTSSSYRVLEQNDALGAAAVVGEAAGVVRIYGVALLLAAVVTALVAWRMTERHQRGVVAWLVACVACTMLTRDAVGALVGGVGLVLYLSRSRAMTLASQRTTTDTVLTSNGVP